MPLVSQREGGNRISWAVASCTIICIDPAHNDARRPESVPGPVRVPVHAGVPVVHARTHASQQQQAEFSATASPPRSLDRSIVVTELAALSLFLGRLSCFSSCSRSSCETERSASRVASDPQRSDDGDRAGGARQRRRPAARQVRRRRPHHPPRFGAVPVRTLASPLPHLHYFTMALPKSAIPTLPACLAFSACSPGLCPRLGLVHWPRLGAHALAPSRMHCSVPPYRMQQGRLVFCNRRI
jgi:hypothetical protein